MEQNFTFSSWAEFVSHAESAPCDLPDGERSSRTGTKSFTDTENLGEALALAKAGWPSGMKKAQKISAPIQTRLYAMVEAHKVMYDVSGEILDIGRYCSGEPEHWGYWEKDGLREGKGTKYVHIVMNGTASSGIEASVLMARGAVVSALVNLLELAGHRAQVDLVYKGEGYGGASSTIRVQLKAYDQPLDLDKLTMALAHPSSFRRLGFAVWETCRQEVRDAVGFGRSRGYGKPDDITDDRGDIYLGKMSYGETDWENHEQAIAWACNKLKELGVLNEDFDPATL